METSRFVNGNTVSAAVAPGFEDFSDNGNHSTGNLTPDPATLEYNHATNEYHLVSSGNGFDIKFGNGVMHHQYPEQASAGQHQAAHPSHHPVQQQHQHHPHQQTPQSHPQAFNFVKNNNSHGFQPGTRIIPPLRHSLGLMNPNSNPDAERAKLEKKRERNRIAATKCRQRKLEKISTLEQQVSTLRSENRQLQDLSESLSKELQQLKNQLDYHVRRGCSDLVNKHEDLENDDDETEVKPNLLGNTVVAEHGLLSQDTSSNVMLCEAAAPHQDTYKRLEASNPDSTCIS